MRLPKRILVLSADRQAGSVEVFYLVLFLLTSLGLGIIGYDMHQANQFKAEVQSTLASRYGVTPTLGDDSLPGGANTTKAVPLLVEGRTVLCEVRAGNRASELAVFCDGSRVALKAKTS